MIYAVSGLRWQVSQDGDPRGSPFACGNTKKWRLEFISRAPEYKWNLRLISAQTTNVCDFPFGSITVIRAPFENQHF